MTRRGPLLGGTAWYVAALLAVLVGLGVATLRPLVSPGPWSSHVLLVLALTLAVATGVRLVSRGRFAGTAAGALVGVLTTWSLYAGPSASPALPVPTPEGARRISLLARSGVEAITDGAIPVEPTRGLGLLLVAGVLAVAVLADLLAGGLGRPALAGVPVLALWAVPVSFARDPAPLLLVVAGTAYLLLLTAGRIRPGSASSASWRDPVALPVAAAVTALAVALGPVAAATGLYGSVRLPGQGAGPGTGPVQVSLELDMRSSLTERTPRTLLSYRLTGSDPGPLRLYTMTRFDGREWLRDPEGDAPLPVEGSLLWPEEPPATSGTVQMAVRVGDLDQDRLPIPLDPRQVSVDARWSYDPVRDEVVARQGTTRGLSYGVEALQRDLTAEILQGLDVAPADGALDLPQTPYLDDVAALAEEITAEAEATTPYDRALALQSWFRDGTNFRYETRIPPARTDDAVWDFLTERSGYCVQFATAMTVMARSLGMPTRIAVGFLPGRAVPGSPGEFAVTGRQAHAWPEIHFVEAGWVRFEPTPAQQTAAPPAYADPLAARPGQTEGPTPSASATTPEGASPTPSRTAGAGGPGSAGSQDEPLVVVAVVALTALVVTAAGTGITWLVRRRRAAHLPMDSERAWESVRRAALDAGVRWGPSTTPRQATDLVARRLRAAASAQDENPAGRRQDRRGRSAQAVGPEGAERAMRRLAAAVTARRYAPSAVEAGPEDLSAWVGAVTTALRDVARRDSARRDSVRRDAAHRSARTRS